MNIQEIAMVAHEVNRAYCVATGDDSQVDWFDAPVWQRESAILGVYAIFTGRVSSPSESHSSWLRQKEKDGWVYGPVKDVEAKKHPCMVSYDELPIEQKVKDALFFTLVSEILDV
jgi:hypothetical protein